MRVRVLLDAGNNGACLVLFLAIPLGTQLDQARQLARDVVLLSTHANGTKMADDCPRPLLAAGCPGKLATRTFREKFVPRDGLALVKMSIVVS